MTLLFVRLLGDSSKSGNDWAKRCRSALANSSEFSFDSLSIGVGGRGLDEVSTWSLTNSMSRQALCKSVIRSCLRQSACRVALEARDRRSSEASARSRRRRPGRARCEDNRVRTGSGAGGSEHPEARYCAAAESVC